jgi:23S rRNA (uracil1939-C5)-methyltransferase
VQGPAFELTITGLGSGGEGVGRKDNMTVFVPGALPGETVSAVIVLQKKNYAIGQLQRVLKASPDRVCLIVLSIRSAAVASCNILAMRAN